MANLNNTYIDCKELSAEKRLIYIKACIGDDLPHEKMCGYGSSSKSELICLYCYDATYLYCSPSGMVSYDESPSPCRMTQQRIVTIDEIINPTIQNETPEEKEAFDRIDTANAQFESLAVEVNSEPVYIKSGIPELGDVCQCRIRNVHSCEEWSKWFECRFQGGYMHKIWVYDCNGMVDHVVAAHDVEFRKKETPEQKADRERDEEFRYLLEHNKNISFMNVEMQEKAMRLMYEIMKDLGYRKPE